MPKVSNLPPDSAPVSSDYVVGNQAVGPATKTFTLLLLATYFWTLANIPAGGTSPITRDNESQFAFVASGGVWSGDSYGVNRNASMTAMVCYINGRRISIAAVTARTFTASVDTYIDVLDNADGTGTLVYTTALNNAASAALAANSLRIGIIVTGATTIAAVGSVNQGQETKILPIASSIAYSVTDSLGNLICPRDPSHRTLGFRQITANTSTASASYVQITGLTVPVIVPTGRKIKLTFTTRDVYNATAANSNTSIWDGVVASGTQIAEGQNLSPATGNEGVPQSYFGLTTPSATSKTYNAGMKASAGTMNIEAGATFPTALLVELV